VALVLTFVLDDTEAKKLDAALGAFEHRSCVEVAPVESHRKGHLQSGQIEAPDNGSVAEIDALLIDLILQLTATATDESSIDRLVPTISNLPAAKRANELVLIHQRSSRPAGPLVSRADLQMTYPR